jgi:hypothetical protein
MYLYDPWFYGRMVGAKLGYLALTVQRCGASLFPPSVGEFAREPLSLSGPRPTAASVLGAATR